ncbi:hypothetical protein SDC9_152632 [bioreactor metagenome]|uniref:Uncharacterized protein n=1 Tax=bioreactor metagenome TaxID=1076179 RepID=A0A645EVX7_9ZZZZ
MQGADSGLPAFRGWRGRFERPAAQRVARDPAGESPAHPHPESGGEPGALGTQEDGRKRTRRLRRILPRIRPGAERGTAHRLRERRKAQGPGSVRIDEHRRRQDDYARRIRRRDAGEPEGDLLHHRREARIGRLVTRTGIFPFAGLRRAVHDRSDR